MNLYVIKLSHHAPKDSEVGIKEYVLAENDKQVFEYLTSKKNSYTYWYYKVDIKEYDDDEYRTAQEQMDEWIENTLEDQGDMWNDSKFTDLYYGATGWYWEEMEDIDCEDYETMLMIETMIKNKMVLDLTKGDMK